MVCTLVNPFGFLDAHPTVADGVLVGLSLGRIHVQRGRQKTSTKQTAPLTNGCREILAKTRQDIFNSAGAYTTFANPVKAQLTGWALEFIFLTRKLGSS